ncbi:hypothetical protein KR52_00260 [Synechococcus sp. KORDI-52]|nr:hypothetical protein KR52_00260 [Synechococcus sp. KORDI-52]
MYDGIRKWLIRKIFEHLHERFGATTPCSLIGCCCIKFDQRIECITSKETNAFNSSSVNFRIMMTKQI